MNTYPPLTKERLDKLLINVGHAINANNGRCGLIEDALIETTTLVCQVTEALPVNAALLAACKEALAIIEQFDLSALDKDRDTFPNRLSAAIAAAAEGQPVSTSTKGDRTDA